ncbi:MAG: hypothetical protein J6V11_04440 [Alphaproteobacteria bacterium]|nr:hypothetical protein [Alphaproteobacteria bacterium]
MKNLIKSIALVGMFAMTAQAEENVQATEKSAAEQHKEAIAAQTQRWIEETRNGVPSKERMEEIIASNRRIIQEIWEKEAKRQSNSRTQ